MRSMPGGEVSVTALPSAAFFVDNTEILLGDVVLSRGSCSPLMLSVTVRPEAILLNLPLTGSGSVVLNGDRLPDCGFGLHGPGARIIRISPQPNRYALLHVGVAAAAGALPQALALLAETPANSTLMAARPQEWSRMARLVNAAADLAEHAPEIFETEPPRQSLRATLLGVAAELIDGTDRGGGTAQRARSPVAWQRIVTGAEEYLKGHLDRPIYTEELCNALGVSAAALSDAFRVTLLMSPHRYLKLRRLNLVRAALMRHDREPPLVKSIALTHGFWHLGQFARDYRETFGETPSETLARSAGQSPAQSASG